MTRTKFLLGVFGALSLSACSSVDVPVERCYRLELPAAAAPDPGRAGTLRVHDLQLGTSLDRDRLLRQRGPELLARPLARWVAPLDRMVTDALVLGLSRARVCELVKGSADPGPESWSLHGRIVDFVEADGEHGAEARVAVELWLLQGDEIVFHDEFTAVEALADGGADAAVEALSRGLQQVVTGVVAHMRAQHLFATVRRERDARAAAASPR
jgi:uncharacterized lipoprotein YmbA